MPSAANESSSINEIAGKAREPRYTNMPQREEVGDLDDYSIGPRSSHRQRTGRRVKGAALGNLSRVWTTGSSTDQMGGCEMILPTNSPRTLVALHAFAGVLSASWP
jgi:hypothetical protein